jgi:hypothetical protein
VVHFVLTADYADLSQNVIAGAIDGCPFEEAVVRGDGAVTVTLQPSVWLDLVDFSDVAAGSETAPTEVEQGSLAQLGFSLGLVQLSAYRFSFSD